MKKSLFFIFLLFITSCGTDTTTKDEGDSTIESTESETDTPVENWSYSTDTDKMEDTKQYYATCTSTNTVEFDFPYDGGSNMNIVIRNLEGSNEVLLTVNTGQFMTSVMESESVRVKFDDLKPIDFSFNSASDGSADVIFLNNEKKFLELLKKSKKVMIEAPFYQAGNVLFEFDTEKLNWDH